MPEAVQPIDTWGWSKSVRRWALLAGDDDRTIRQNLLAACCSSGVSAADFNTGAWYLGTHSLEIALELFQRTDVMCGLTWRSD